MITERTKSNDGATSVIDKPVENPVAKIEVAEENKTQATPTLTETMKADVTEEIKEEVIIEAVEESKEEEEIPSPEP